MTESIQVNPARRDQIKMVQITDPHIFAEADDRFEGVDTKATLQTVIQAINDLQQQPDLILATGDLVHDGVENAYLRLREQLLQLTPLVFCIPGNHDQPALLHALLNQDNIHTTKTVECGAWTILMLDSYLPGSHNGLLHQDELAFLRDALVQTAGQHVFLCLHHPPVSVHSPWMDSMMLENPNEFFAIIDDFSHIRGVLWGHIHQPFAMERNGVHLLGTPSTCLQFTPGTERFIRADNPPAYRELLLQADGTIETSIRYVIQH